MYTHPGGDFILCMTFSLTEEPNIHVNMCDK